MSLYEIDHAATQARLDAITADGLRKLGDAARRSEEVDKQTKEMLARQEREKKAMDEQVAQAKAAAEPETPAAPPKPVTLALGGEEFAEARATREQDRLPTPPQPAQQTPHHGVPLPGRLAFQNPARPRPPAPQPPPVHQPPVSPPRRTLALGAPEDREQPQPPEAKQPEKQAEKPPDKPKTRPRRPPAEPDDDMSGRTWLR